MHPYKQCGRWKVLPSNRLLIWIPKTIIKFKKYCKKCAFSWFLSHRCITMHGSKKRKVNPYVFRIKHRRINMCVIWVLKFSRRQNSMRFSRADSHVMMWWFYDASENDPVPIFRVKMGTGLFPETVEKFSHLEAVVCPRKFHWICVIAERFQDVQSVTFI